MTEPGELIGPYRLVSQLGRGAMGEVWRARDERLDRYVALKVLPPDLASDAEHRVRMLREARAAAAIRHANVVTLFDIVEHRGDDILVMELVEGRTLSEHLRKEGPPPLATALRWIEAIADALVTAHARGILHRDIKAANVMIGSDGQPKVLDFGLAKLRDGGAPAAPRPRIPPPAASIAGLAIDETMPSGSGAVQLEATMPSGSGAVQLEETMPSGSDGARLAATQPSGSGGVPLEETMPSGSDGARLAATQPSGSSGARLAATQPSGSSGARLAATQPETSAPPPGASATLPAVIDPSLYETRAGSLLGTPLYMAPEQLEGAAPDERTEVFSVGVLAYEILAGRPPYTATSMDELFRQIATAPVPPIPKLADSTFAIVARALAKDPAARWPTMQALRDAVAAERRRLFAPPARRWPLVAAAALLVAGAGAGLLWRHAHRPAPARPGDKYVARALEEYDVFYNEKALSSLRAALALAPDHPRANAYMILFGYASDADVAAAVAAAPRARAVTAPHSKDRALLDAAVALVQRGPAAAHDALVATGAEGDRELAFWTAELDYRAGRYAKARAEYDALLAEPAEAFRGRIYDHDSAVLLYLDDPAAALKIGKLYRDAFPGEPDAIAVYATTLAADGQLDAAAGAAEDALRLSEGEDTLAGLAKVLALQGDHARAEELYRRSIEKAGPSRRAIRRAALAFLQWIDGDVAAAQATVAPCLPGGEDGAAHERGACLFVAGVIDPAHAEAIAHELDGIAAEATPSHPAYGAPASLAALVRARAKFFGGGCVVERDLLTGPPAAAAADEAAYALPLDFYAAYHVPFFATWAACEHAALLAARGDKAGAAALLRPIATRAPGRTWLLHALATYE